MDWRTLAACRGALDPDVFFPADRKGSVASMAKATCRRCPVWAECRTWALAHEPYGIWGGLDEHERARLRRPTRGPTR